MTAQRKENIQKRIFATNLSFACGREAARQHRVAQKVIRVKVERRRDCAEQHDKREHRERKRGEVKARQLALRYEANADAIVLDGRVVVRVRGEEILCMATKQNQSGEGRAH